MYAGSRRRQTQDAEEEAPVESHDIVFDPITAENAADSTMAVPHDLSTNARDAIIMSALKRVCEAGPDGANSAVWAPLLSRLISRGLTPVEDATERDVESAERLRQVLFTFICGHLESRCGASASQLLSRTRLTSRSCEGLSSLDCGSTRSGTRPGDRQRIP